MTLQELNQKYHELCTQMGDCSYKIRQHEALLKSLQAQADALNEEAAKIKESAKASEAKND